jgi:hypothetical protein
MGLKLSKSLKNVKSEAPGPGEYDIQSGVYNDPKKGAAPNFRIGTAPQRSGGVELKQALENPGPGNYDVLETAVRRASPKCGLGLAKRMSYQSQLVNTPDKVGPGSYEAKEYTGAEGRKVTLAMRYEADSKKSRLNEPGPGQYDLSLSLKSVKRSLPSYIMGSPKKASNKAMN